MLKLIYSPEAIAARVADLANTLNRDLSGTKLLHTIVTMNGACMFAADLTRQLKIPQVLHFTGGSFFQGAIKQEVAMDPATLPNNFHLAPVLIIEDILDGGDGVKNLRQMLGQRAAGPVTVITLFKRVGSQALADHYAFSLPKELFVVGYGLDMDGRYRELPGIHAFESGVMSGTSGVC